MIPSFQWFLMIGFELQLLSKKPKELTHETLATQQNLAPTNQPLFGTSPQIYLGFLLAVTRMMSPTPQLLGFPWYFSWRNGQTYACFWMRRRENTQGRYEHKTESHMWITEPFVCVLQSLQIAWIKRRDSWDAEVDGLNNTSWAAKRNMSWINRRCLCAPT